MMDLQDRIEDAWKFGIESDQVVYSATTSVSLVDETGIPFEARYVPCLDKKPTSRSPSPEADQQADTTSDTEGGDKEEEEEEGGGGSTDPFAAPRDNVVLEMAEYTCVLNKYALEKEHFLIVTNEFYPQQGRLRESDLDMIHSTVNQLPNRYCFFNGGHLAGASQEHRHFQFLTLPKSSWPQQIHDQPGKQVSGDQVRCHPDINAHHFFLPIHDANPLALQASFDLLYNHAKQAVESTTRHENNGDENENDDNHGEEEEMAYNFLMTKQYMLLFPRRHEEWDEHEIGVGGTCLVGSIMVTKQTDLKHVQSVGIKRILEYVGFPKYK